MIKEVRYNGYSASPSDYECADGDLAMSLNAINEDGALRPVLQPKSLLHIQEGHTVKCVHETSVYKHYIIHNGTTLLYVDDKEGSIELKDIDSFNKEIYQVTPVGNTLVVLTSEGMYYFLWKDDKYISLGDELPELNVSPYISTQLINTKSFRSLFDHDFDNPEISESIIGVGDNLNEILYRELCDELLEGTIKTITLHDKRQQSVYEKVFSAVNPRSKLLKKKGYFFEPFYVRFAYRLYDGSHTRHTVPVLMVPTTWGKPLLSVIITKGTGSNNESTTTACVEPIYLASKLFADIITSSDIDDWKDIITDIDVFVTEPLIDYSDNAKSLLFIKRLYDGNTIIPKGMVALYDKSSVWKDISELSAEKKDEYITEYYVDIWFKKQSDGTGMTQTLLFFIQNGQPVTGDYIAFDCSKYTVCSDVLSPKNPEGYNIPSGMNMVIYSISEYKELDETSAAYAFETKEVISEDEFAKINTYIIGKGVAATIAGEFYIESQRVDGQSYEAVLEDYNTFYKISEINLSKKFDGTIDITEWTLNNLTTHQTLSDLGQCHNKPVSKHSFSYNNRLNLIIEKEQIRNACTSLKKQNPASYMDDTSEEIRMACVEIYENGQKVLVEIPLSDGAVYMRNLLSFSFPHNSASNLHLYNFKSGEVFYKRTIPLKQHKYLNLSYAFNMFAPLDFTSSEQITESDFTIQTNDTIDYGNIIRLSDVNNPFRFSEEYSVSLPVSKIYALSTAAKALSQGQFGQYPLYAFTSDGIWALEITSTGTYSARQPISRDVVINPDSITQLDNAVLFAAQRGIMLLSGSEVACISDRLNTEDLFDITSLPKFDILIRLFNEISVTSIEPPVSQPEDAPPVAKSGVSESVIITDSITIDNIRDIKPIPFYDFIKDCRMLYDYLHQRLIVYNPNVRYAYVYSFKSQLWGMMLSNLMENVNSYPEALAMTNDNKLVDFSQYNTGRNKVLLITRPFKMDLPDVHKTITSIIQRGIFNNRTIAQVLYASNDLDNWFVVWSSNDIKMTGFRGTPYKYYRIAIIRTFDKSESLYGFSVQYEPRLTNRLR